MFHLTVSFPHPGAGHQLVTSYTTSPCGAFQLVMGGPHSSLVGFCERENPTLQMDDDCRGVPL